MDQSNKQKIMTVNDSLLQILYFNDGERRPNVFVRLQIVVSSYKSYLKSGTINMLHSFAQVTGKADST